MRDPCIAGKTGNIKDLTHATRTEPDKVLKYVQVVYGRDLTDVALDIRPNVVPISVDWVEMAIVQGWILSLKKQLIERGNTNASRLELAEGKG